MNNLNISARHAEILGGVLVAAFLIGLIWTLTQLMEETAHVEEAASRLDVAAYQIASVLEEARRITIDAADGKDM